MACEKYHVEELYLFGSYANGKNNKNSDIDLLVTFKNVDPLEYFDNFMDFKSTMEKIFNKDVDLVESQTLKNPFLINSINKDKILIYGRENPKVAI
jgi:predicted nucleotidyltransferase